MNLLKGYPAAFSLNWILYLCGWFSCFSVAYVIKCQFILARLSLFSCLFLFHMLFASSSSSFMTFERQKKNYQQTAFVYVGCLLIGR